MLCSFRSSIYEESAKKRGCTFSCSVRGILAYIPQVKVEKFSLAFFPLLFFSKTADWIAALHCALASPLCPVFLTKKMSKFIVNILTFSLKDKFVPLASMNFFFKRWRLYWFPPVINQKPAFWRICGLIGIMFVFCREICWLVTRNSDQLCTFLASILEEYLLEDDHLVLIHKFTKMEKSACEGQLRLCGWISCVLDIYVIPEETGWSWKKKRSLIVEKPYTRNTRWIWSVS